MCLGVPLMSIILGLIRPNLPIGLRHVCLLVPFTNVVINVFTRRLGNTATMDVTFCEDRPHFPVSHLQGESEESNITFEYIKLTPSIGSNIDVHPIVLPTNQVP